MFFILKDVNTDEAFFYKEPKNIQVETTNYSEELFLLLDEYFKKKNRSGCDDYIKENFN